MARRAEGAAALSPLEESAAEVSSDSGVASRSESGWSTAWSEGLSSGSVSQSPSFGAGAAAAAAPSSPSPSRCDIAEEQLLTNTARCFSACVRANAEQEIFTFEKNLEEMLTRVDEFVGMLDMIRGDTSQVVDEHLPQIHGKASDMRAIYRKIDKLEAFVKMVGANVSEMEEHVSHAEAQQGSLPGAFKKIFRSMGVPMFLNKPASPSRPPPQQQELPAVFRTEDYLPTRSEL